MRRNLVVSGEEDTDDRRGGSLTTGEVARRLGVAPTTVRSWDRRYGLGPEAHTGGRHRRWTPADVARLERMCSLTATGLPRAARPRDRAGGRVAVGPVPDDREPSPRPARGRQGVGGARGHAGGTPC